MEKEPDITTFRADRPGVRKVLGDLEAEIMEFIWSHPSQEGVTVRDVFEVLYERRHLAYTTIMNTMTRLAKKRLLRIEKRDQAYVYFPTYTRDAFISCFVGRFLDDLLVNFSGAALQHLQSLRDAEGIARLQQLMQEVERRKEEER
ncbi:MAG: BlaI/MecI/CopY family transcriptional regulator [Ktedonobacteraceae bacterium]|nr:BlaI/MecI/CopY family transcriptional regulator [Ktedonobacteraceae bacterium]